MPHIFSWFDRNKDWGVFLLRLFIGLRLIYGVLDNVISWEHMVKFADFLKNFHFPFPIVSAVISVYLQLLAGVMIVLGLQIRLASILMIANFFIALLMVHRDDSVEGMTPPMAILFCCIFFLFQGAGRISLDKKVII